MHWTGICLILIIRFDGVYCHNSLHEIRPAIECTIFLNKSIKVYKQNQNLI